MKKILGNAGLGHPVRVGRPGLGQEQRQADRHGHLAARQRERHQRLAVGGLAQRGGVLRRDPDRVVARLRQGGVVDDEDRICTADQAIGLVEKRLLKRRLIPDPGGDKVVQPIIGNPIAPRRYRLDALAVAKADQTGHVKGAHRPACRMRQARQERLQPSIQIVTPSAST